MRKPKRRNHPRNANRVAEWKDRFVHYRVAPSGGDIDRWIGQFSGNDKDIAARVLDSVEIIAPQQISTGLRSGLERIPGWSASQEERQGDWALCSLAASPGESGDAMLHQLRTSLNMGSRKYNNLFKSVSELPGLGFGDDDTIVFVDDFSGTGKQIIDFWNNVVQELLSDGPSIYVLLVAITEISMNKIRDNTEFIPVSQIVLNKADNFFDEECKFFWVSEKESVHKYCEKISRNPKGFGESGLLFVLPHRCPNNSLPILHQDTGGWVPLFPRHF